MTKIERTEESSELKRQLQKETRGRPRTPPSFILTENRLSLECYEIPVFIR